MRIGQWWPLLSESTQVWLLQNLDSPLPPEVADDIAKAGGPEGDQLSEADAAWIEEVGNGGSPE